MIINENNNSLPFIISIPHSGQFLTDKMKSNLKEDAILSNMDWYLIELYSFLSYLGYTQIIKNMSSYGIDVNRDILNSGKKYTNSLIYLKNTFDKELYKNEITESDKYDRINIYLDYHNKLKSLINQKLKYFDKIFLIDLHSFGMNLDCDIVLGNNYNETMNKNMSDYIKYLFELNDFKVVENNPFRGGYITREYSKMKNVETLQIELNYRSYIDNRDFTQEECPNINYELFNNCEQRLKKIFKCLGNKEY